MNHGKAASSNESGSEVGSISNVNLEQHACQDQMARVARVTVIGRWLVTTYQATMPPTRQSKALSKGRRAAALGHDALQDTMPQGDDVRNYVQRHLHYIQTFN